MKPGSSWREKCQGEGREKGEIRVRANLMPFVNFAAYPVRVHGVVDIPPVLTIHKKCGLDTVALEDVQDLVGINVGAIIKCDSKGSRRGTLSDDLSYGYGRGFHLVSRDQILLRGIGGSIFTLSDIQRDRFNGQGQGREGYEAEELHGGEIS